MKKHIKRKLRMVLMGIAIFIIASMLSVYSYGKFASRVKGAPSYALPTQINQTKLDRIIEPYLQELPNRTGLMLLRDNLDAFLARAISAREAERSLDLQYYIWHNDLTGQLLDLEILQAADRGVRVRMILDDMTAHGRESALAALNLHENIEIRLFNPTRSRENSLLRGVEMVLRLVNMNRRMHNKAWIADNRVAIVGGRNIGDEYFNAASNVNFFDIDLLLSGAAVQETSAIFDDFWNSNAVIPLSALHQAKPDTLEKLRKAALEKYNNIEAIPYIQYIKQTPNLSALHTQKLPVYWSDNVHVYSDPAEKGLGLGEEKWLINTLYPLWKNTQTKFQIISPYFVPGTFGTEEFTSLVTAGAEVHILTNSLAATDVVASHSGYVPYREPLFDAGVKLYELKPFAQQKQKLIGSSGASLHTKAFLIDNKLGFIGSFNFDPRSANLNTEMGVLFTEPHILGGLNEEFKERTSGQFSYQLKRNAENNLIWIDYPDTRNTENKKDDSYKEWEHEPETSWIKRAAAKVLSWLPIEWLL